MKQIIHLCFILGLIINSLSNPSNKKNANIFSGIWYKHLNPQLIPGD